VAARKKTARRRACIGTTLFGSAPSREWQIEEEEAISGAERLLSEIDHERICRMKTDELDRLVAAGRIKEIGRERVRFIVRRIVQPPERPDDPSSENADRSG
jgi:hypothetical protein